MRPKLTGGRPISRVMKMGRNADEMIAGVLHDVIEDSSWTFGDIQMEGFSAEIVGALLCLTKTSERKTMMFFERIAKNPLAIAVKIHDLAHNMNVRRLPYIGDREIVRLNKYLKAYRKLKSDYDAHPPFFG